MHVSSLEAWRRVHPWRGRSHGLRVTWVTEREEESMNSRGEVTHNTSISYVIHTCIVSILLPAELSTHVDTYVYAVFINKAERTMHMY